MKRFIQNSVLALIPYIVLAVICGIIFGYFLVFLVLAVLAFIFTQLLQLYYLQKWCSDQSIIAPSAGLNRIWKNVYTALETRLSDRNAVPELDINELQNIEQGDYGLMLLEDNRIKWMNKQASVLLQLSADRDITTDISHSLRSPSFIDALDKKCYGQQIILQDRQPPIAVCLLPYGVRYLCVLVRDISHFMEIKNTNRELIANVAHELCSPLTVINGYLEILREKNEETKDEALQKILDNMQRQVERMKVLADDTLNIVYLENNELKEQDQSSVDIAETLESVLESLKIGSEKIRFDTQIEAFKLHGCASELYSVFYNLIDNSKDHSQSEDIKIVWRRDDQAAYFEVSDKGIGIEAYHLPKLSKRFYRVDSARSGSKGNTGLGLSIVKHVLDRHQATLEIESEVGKGSTFRCRFPISRIV